MILDPSIRSVVAQRLMSLPSGSGARSDAIDGQNMRPRFRDERSLAASVLHQIVEEEGFRNDALDLEMINAIVDGIAGVPKGTGGQRSDATEGFALEGQTLYAGGRLFDPRQRTYSVPGLLPTVVVPASTEFYTKRFRDVTVDWQLYQSGDQTKGNAQGKVDESDPRYIPSFSATYTVGKDWLGELLQSARANHISPAQMEAAARRGAARINYKLSITGEIAAAVYNLKTCPAGRHAVSTITYGTGSTIQAMCADFIAAAHVFIESQDGYAVTDVAGNPVEQAGFRCLITDRVKNRVMGSSNLSGGGSIDGWTYLRRQLEELGFEVVVVGRDLRGLGDGSTSSAPVDRCEFHNIADQERGLARVSCLEPTIVNTWTERGQRVVQWGARFGGLDIVDPSMRHVYDVPVTPGNDDILPNED